MDVQDSAVWLPQRSLPLTIKREISRDALYEVVKSRKTGYGWDSDTNMGPVITPESKKRVESLIQKGVDEGANVLLDGRRYCCIWL